MTDMTPRKIKGSLLERAAKLYDLGTPPPVQVERRVQQVPQVPQVPQEPAMLVEHQVEPQEPGPQPIRGPASEEAPRPRARAVRPTGAAVAIDRHMLAEKGLLVPGAPIGALVEEFRQVKRQLLQTARVVKKVDGDRSRTVLVCSAQPTTCGDVYAPTSCA